MWKIKFLLSISSYCNINRQTYNNGAQTFKLYILQHSTFMGEVHEGWHKQFSMHHIINMFFSNINKQYGNLYVRKSMGLKLLLVLLMIVVVIWWELRFRIMWASAHAYDYIWIGYLLYERLFAFKYVGCHSCTFPVCIFNH